MNQNYFDLHDHEHEHEHEQVHEYEHDHEYQDQDEDHNDNENKNYHGNEKESDNDNDQGPGARLLCLIGSPHLHQGLVPPHPSCTATLQLHLQATNCSSPSRQDVQNARPPDIPAW